MGTSGAYGGSGREAWKRARRLVSELESGPAGAGTSDGDSEAEDQALTELWSAIGEALEGEDPTLNQPVSDNLALPLDSLLPRLRSTPGSGSGGAGGGVIQQGRREPTGRKGSGSKRSVVRNAARGGVVIGAGYALRQGDAAGLADLGLDLDQLRTLSPVRQCAAILDAVLGEGSHPDEYALRKASLESLKSILLSEAPPSELDALRGFVISFVFELALVELQKDLDAGNINAVVAARHEHNIRRYLERRVIALQLPTTGALPVSEFRRVAAKLTQEAIRVLRGAEAA